MALGVRLKSHIPSSAAASGRARSSPRTARRDLRINVASSFSLRAGFYAQTGEVACDHPSTDSDVKSSNHRDTEVTEVSCSLCLCVSVVMLLDVTVGWSLVAPSPPVRDDRQR